MGGAVRSCNQTAQKNEQHVAANNCVKLILKPSQDVAAAVVNK